MGGVGVGVGCGPGVARPQRQGAVGRRVGVVSRVVVDVDGGSAVGGNQTERPEADRARRLAKAGGGVVGVERQDAPAGHGDGRIDVDVAIGRQRQGGGGRPGQRRFDDNVAIAGCGDRAGPAGPGGGCLFSDAGAGVQAVVDGERGGGVDGKVFRIDQPGPAVGVDPGRAQDHAPTGGLDGAGRPVRALRLQGFRHVQRPAVGHQPHLAAAARHPGGADHAGRITRQRIDVAAFGPQLRIRSRDQAGVGGAAPRAPELDREAALVQAGVAQQHARSGQQAGVAVRRSDGA